MMGWGGIAKRSKCNITREVRKKHRKLIQKKKTNEKKASISDIIIFFLQEKR
jgi:hypothetical protein